MWLCNSRYRGLKTRIWRLQYRGWRKFYECLQEVVRNSICCSYTTRSSGSSSLLLHTTYGYTQRFSFLDGTSSPSDTESPSSIFSFFFFLNFWYLSWPVFSGVLVSILDLLKGSYARTGMALIHVLMMQKIPGVSSERRAQMCSFPTQKLYTEQHEFQIVLYLF